MIHADVIDLRDITDNDDRQIICDAMGWDIAEYEDNAENEPTLISDSYFIEYARELAEDCGMVDANATWPNNCIDWKWAARELQYDYMCYEFESIGRYWIRSV